MYRTQDLRVKEIVRLLTPRELKALSPTPEAVNGDGRAQPPIASSAFCGRKTRACSSSSGHARFTTKKARWNTRRG